MINFEILKHKICGNSLPFNSAKMENIFNAERFAKIPPLNPSSNAAEKFMKTIRKAVKLQYKMIYKSKIFCSKY